MSLNKTNEPDFGAGEKKFGIYLLGIIGCTVLTLISFWAVMSLQVEKRDAFIIIFSSACAQFFVQLFCFLRLNVRTEQSRINVMSIVFTAVVLITIVVGSLWIMSNLNYFMMH